MDNLKAWGSYYISHRRVGPMDAVMFDIDDTLIFTNGKANVPMIELLREAKAMGYKIVIITARPGLTPVIHWTIKQLGNYGIGFDYIGFTSAATKSLMKQQLPYKVRLSVGDLPTDLTDSQHFLNISSFYHN